MHPPIMRFLHKSIPESGLNPRGKRVVEFGSMDMNGSPRPLFRGAASYTGIDWRDGPGVDIVALAHEVDVQADVAICCQVFEHDPHWNDTIGSIVRSIRDGGWLFLTWAGPDEQPHELDVAPLVDGKPYYRNLAIGEVVESVAINAKKAGLSVEMLHAEYHDRRVDALVWCRLGNAP